MQGRKLMSDLYACRSLTGDDVRILKGRDQDRALLALDLCGDVFA